MTARLIVSTDLDGTLLDHHTYSFDAALPALTLCAQQDVPVLLNTSKTLAEVITLQQAIGLSTPLITENGSALTVMGELNIAIEADANGPKVVTENGMTSYIFGVTRERILNFIADLRRNTNWQFVGFNDWSVAEIAEHTGLSLEAAQQAAQKQYSEPIVWQGSDEELVQFEAQVQAADLSLLKGGRFYHIQGKTDKAKPLLWLKTVPQLLWPDSDGNPAPKLICLGDNHNDVAMLNVADFPVCVRSPVADFPPLSSDHPVLYTQGLGPIGWNEAMHQLLTH